MISAARTIYTLGHSDRDPVNFLNLMTGQGVKRVIDIRRYPFSRRYPNYSRGSLQMALAAAGFVYRWEGDALGGRRAAHVNSPHVGLDEHSLRGFADHMEGKQFTHTMRGIIDAAIQDRTVLVCAERLPEHCHRNLIADYLLLQGCRILHLVTEMEVREHRLHPLAQEIDGRLVYNREMTIPLVLL